MQETYERLLKIYSPMSEQSFLLLSSLLNPLHGYGIMQTVSRMTDNRVNLGSGTVYTLLYKMEQDNLIKVIDEYDRRKIYSITPMGKKILAAECERTFKLATIAQGVYSSLHNIVGAV